jgi:hypothetical protein
MAEAKWYRENLTAAAMTSSRKLSVASAYIIAPIPTLRLFEVLLGSTANIVACLLFGRTAIGVVAAGSVKMDASAK